MIIAALSVKLFWFQWYVCDSTKYWHGKLSFNIGPAVDFQG